MMIGGLRHVAWDDPTEAIPAFLTVILMPLAVSITEGVAFGVLSYALLKLASRPRPRGPSAALRRSPALFSPDTSSSGDSAMIEQLLRHRIEASSRE